MNRRTTITTVAAALALAGSTLPGQLAKGAEAPEFEFQKTWGDGPKKFEDLHGKVVLLELFATW